MFQNIHWPRAILGAVLAEAGVVAASFVWVAIYSYVVNPGQPIEVYQQYAQSSAPWVSILAGLPIFFAAARWVARNRPSAIAMWAIVFVFDAALLAISGIGTLSPWVIALSYLTKFLASYLGGRNDVQTVRPSPAA
jgi:hypothetical protein